MRSLSSGFQYLVPFIAAALVSIVLLGIIFGADIANTSPRSPESGVGGGGGGGTSTPTNTSTSTSTRTPTPTAVVFDTPTTLPTPTPITVDTPGPGGPGDPGGGGTSCGGCGYGEQSVYNCNNQSAPDGSCSGGNCSGGSGLIAEPDGASPGKWKFKCCVWQNQGTIHDSKCCSDGSGFNPPDGNVQPNPVPLPLDQFCGTPTRTPTATRTATDTPSYWPTDTPTPNSEASGVPSTEPSTAPSTAPSGAPPSGSASASPAPGGDPCEDGTIPLGSAPTQYLKDCCKIGYAARGGSDPCDTLSEPDPFGTCRNACSIGFTE